jgi:hypothetical protein
MITLLVFVVSVILAILLTGISAEIHFRNSSADMYGDEVFVLFLCWFAVLFILGCVAFLPLSVVV